MPPAVGTKPKYKLHDNYYQKITGPVVKNDESLKTCSTVIQEANAYFKFHVFYKKFNYKVCR